MDARRESAAILLYCKVSNDADGVFQQNLTILRTFLIHPELFKYKTPAVHSPRDEQRLFLFDIQQKVLNFDLEARSAYSLFLLYELMYSMVRPVLDFRGEVK